jgi:hypothetical protein
MARLTREQLSKLQRRTFLQAGGVSALGMSLPGLLGSQQPAHAASSATPSATACIMLYMTGGPAQQETFDMKPEAPEAPRGIFRPIPTDIPGIDICELLPMMARTAHRYTIIRSTYHDHTFHGAGTHLNVTGFPHAPRKPSPEYYIDRRDAPSIGAVIQKLRGSRNSLPAAVQLPYWILQGSPFAGQHAGFLGSKYDPHLMVYKETDELPGWLPTTYRLPDSVPQDRLSRRAQLLQLIERDNPFDHLSKREFSKYQSQAVEILNSSGAWRAFSIDDEKAETIERYGDHKFGRSCLVARRLIEAGVSLVMVPWWPGNFDTHQGHFTSMRDELLPPLDRAFSALLEDLDQRGLLEETLVAWTGEFGRTPALNGNKLAGRDHWPYVYSTVLAGGGIRGGHVYGSSDNIAARPKDEPVHVRDFVATIYHALGYDRSSKVIDPRERPHYFVPGTPVLELFR